MATKSMYTCTVCKKGFTFKSKYNKHLKTREHLFNIVCEELSSSACDYSESLYNIPDPPVDEADTRPELTLCIDAGFEQLNEAASSDEMDPDEEIMRLMSTIDSKGNYKPFMSNVAAMAYLLAHSPWSMEQINLEFVFYTLRCLHPSVPSVSSCMKFRVPGFVSPTKHSTSNNIPFYVNAIYNTLKMCLANPDIVNNLVRYPIISSEYRCSSHIQQFLCHDGCEGVFANAQLLENHHRHQDILNCYILGPMHKVSVQDIETMLPPLSEWASRTHIYNFKDGSSLDSLTEEEYTTLASVHSMKLKSIEHGGIPVIMVPLMVFTDDTSGSKSKIWNKFDSWCFQLAGLPKKENANLQNIHFICSSNQAPVMEMAKPLVKQFLALEDGIVLFDALLQCDVIAVAPILCFLCDNSLCFTVVQSHGATSNMFCRICNETKKSKICGNSMLFFTSQCIFIEPYKYLLRAMMAKLSKKKKRTQLSALLSAFPSCGFTSRISRNIANYYKSSVGRDFKALAQMALFVLSPFLAPAEIEVWLALSKVFKIAYCDRYKAFSYFTEEVQNPLASSSCYNTERCESYNSLIRCRNIYSNRQAPSKDIANSFAIQESIRFAFAESSYSLSERCGNDLIALYRSMGVQHYLGGTSVQHDKPIHQPGTLRKHVGSSELGSIVLNAPDLYLAHL
ncbi:hypothetical protein EMCRGX_G011605 [Ephydatia muelleri]